MLQILLQLQFRMQLVPVELEEYDGFDLFFLWPVATIPDSTRIKRTLLLEWWLEAVVLRERLFLLFDGLGLHRVILCGISKN